MKIATFLAVSGPLGCNSLMKKELEGYFCENYSITNVILSEKKKGI